MERGQPAVLHRADLLERLNTGSGGAGRSPPAADARGPGGRKAARHHRRQERAETVSPVPVVFELAGCSPGGERVEHRGTREACEAIAADLRAQGWMVTWWPLTRAPAAKMYWRG
jgi:hypothetical protein